MPDANLTDIRDSLGAGARIREGSDLLCDMIAAGPGARVQRVAYEARKLREDVERLAEDDRPELWTVAAGLQRQEQRLLAYAVAL